MHSLFRKVAVKKYKYNKYVPHQGKKECEKRINKPQETQK